jgi:hypothetical protein
LPDPEHIASNKGCGTKRSRIEAEKVDAEGIERSADGTVTHKDADDTSSESKDRVSTKGDRLK